MERAARTLEKIASPLNNEDVLPGLSNRPESRSGDVNMPPVEEAADVAIGAARPLELCGRALRTDQQAVPKTWTSHEHMRPRRTKKPDGCWKRLPDHVTTRNERPDLSTDQEAAVKAR